MTNRGCALLAFKLLGLWLMAQAAIGTAGLPMLWSDTRFDEVRGVTIAFMFLPVLVSIAIGVPVWFSADWFAARIFPGAWSEPASPDRIRAEPLFALALAVIGVVFVCESLPALVNSAGLFLQSRTQPHSMFGPSEVDMNLQHAIWHAGAKANAVAALARLAIGIGLIVGPAKLSAAVTWFGRELRGPLTIETATEEIDPKAHTAARPESGELREPETMPQFARDTIAVVLDPGYGDRVAAVAAAMPVWLVDTPANRAAAERVRAGEGLHDVTTFVVALRESPQDAFIRLLPTVDLHHGECSQKPPYSSLLVLGIAPSAEARAALAEFGLAMVEEREDGFRATRSQNLGKPDRPT